MREGHYAKFEFITLTIRSSTFFSAPVHHECVLQSVVIMIMVLSYVHNSNAGFGERWILPAPV